MASVPDARRARHLYAVFKGALDGERKITTATDAKLFFEAIQGQRPPGVCVEKIISSKPGPDGVRPGLDAVSRSVRVDLSLAFVVSHTLKFIGYLSDPGIKALAGGQLLRQILEAIANPPTLWNCLVNLCLTREIAGEALQSFAWLMLELLSFPSSQPVDVVADVERIVKSGVLMQATTHETRGLGHRILKVLQIKTSGSAAASPDGYTPGGRHDNDHANFRDIAIYPTRDEFLSKEKPFYRTAKEVSDTDDRQRAGTLIDNQYRLLREDLLAELREGVHVATGRKKNKRAVFTLRSVRPVLLHFGTDKRAMCTKPCLVGITSDNDQKLQYLNSLQEPQRKKLLKDQPGFLKHQAFGVLYDGDDIYGFAFVDRDIDLLCRSPPVVLLQFADNPSFRKSLLAMKTTDVQFTLVDTPVFAYEPVLNGLKQITELPLHDALVNTKTGGSAFKPETTIRKLIDRLAKLPKNAEGFVKLPLTASSKSVDLDEPQLQSIINALQNELTIIQGPPGTGKSFLGAHIARYLHMLSNVKILVISYTHHAIDQFLEDLIKIGIPEETIVRLGSKAKCTSATAPLLLFKQQRVHSRSRTSWAIMDNLRDDGTDVAEQLSEAFNTFRNFSVSWREIEEHLEFSQNEQNFYEAFKVPTNENGWRVARGRGQQAVRPDYLFQRWIRGQDRGVFFRHVSDTSKAVWNIPPPIRRSHVERWSNELINNQLGTLQELSRQYNSVHNSLDTLRDEDNVHILKSKRFIGCTTTAAAKYAHLIRQAEPDVVLVEEAGEILESHILTSLSGSVKQLILIGDHKQLRPKVNNYQLTVEKGDGFDLNRSLFERLILNGANFTTLRRQHRMAPEISTFPRSLTYPELIDGPKTIGRPRIRGLQGRVVFLGHSKLEVQDDALSERRDPTSKSSKKNVFEAEMVLKCVRYMAQQGYGSEQMVVLTPYLGQLRQLREQLKNDHDPVLNDIDAFELIRAGLLTEAAARIDKKPLRISTIDNYQGEESDIVIASLTRSNPSGDIGFMKAPERLNVLLSRARDCLILIGNPETFMKSPQGRDTWLPFFNILKEAGQLHDGFPVKCEQHPDRTALLREPLDFDKYCPDGGCAEPCGAKLKCGAHVCQLRCHRVADHSKTECSHMIGKTCTRNHRTRVPCSRQDAACVKCIIEDKEQERRIKRDLRLEEDRLKRQAAYAQELQEIKDALDHQRRLIKYQEEDKQQKKTLTQAKADLDALKLTAARVQQQKREEDQRDVAAASQAPASTQQTGVAKGKAKDGVSEPDDLIPGSAREDWELLKKYEDAVSEPLDKLMGMIGLEEVKKEFLSIKNKVDTTLRQGLSLSKERFSCSLLGNPGTGKTTVARFYGQFLTSVGVLPGACFKETTGSSLANLGVSGCKKLIDEILDDGGGVLFIDEAYQLVSGNNPGGGAVLDYLLPEVEDLRGKVVFVLAGYNKQMEAFFAHNPGLPSRFPIEMKFADYTDDELLSILVQKINQSFAQRMKCEDGIRGLYCRIVARRIGRGRDRDGFGNARTVENMISIIRSRQANRLRQERRADLKPDDMLFVKTDLIGPEPSAALAKSQAWIKLQKLIGLTTVKEAVKALVDTAQQNYQRELAEEPPIEYSLNKVFLGSPGTGKTTVAKLYGAILVDLCMLSKGEVIVKNPSDFVGSALGQSENQTKAILAASVGKVLVIDEAYGLYGGGGGSTSDPYKTAVIDTIVAEVQSVPGDDRCVLLLGYKENMENMFQNVNPGLARRFPIASAFSFEDFNDNELRQILDMKLDQQGFQATKSAKEVAMEMLNRARNRPNFGNAGEVDIILNTAKARHQARFSRGEAKSSHLLEPVDFDENFNRAEKSVTNVRMLFEATVGCDRTVEILEGYQQTVRTMKELGMDPKESIPFNFLFRGPPGTGKTTTARKMGKVFFDMGFLATAEVVECSATDLIGQYLGQTGPKVQQKLDQALGKILFVDEAYRLVGGHFAKEAMDELVDSTTKERYHKRMIIILAGYEDDINQLMSSNPGLTSRFPEVINFRPLSSPECAALLVKRLANKKKMLAENGWNLDLSALENPSRSFDASLAQLLTELTAQSNWANARDVETLSNGIFTKTTKQTRSNVASRSLKVEETTILSELGSMLKERAARAASVAKLQSPLSDPLQQLPPQAPVLRSAPVSTTVATTTTSRASLDMDPDDGPVETPPAFEIQQDNDPHSRGAAQRDAGVSDAVWEQLQRDRKAEQEREDEYQRLLQASRKASEAEREKIVKRLLEEERRRKEEEKLRQKLAMNGLCPMGYNWIKQNGGFRCAGGSHFVSNTQLAALT